MLRNYFKIAWRNIRKHPFYAGVNIIGLFTGITFALLIGAFVWQEFQVNRQIKNYRQQYFLQHRVQGEIVNFDLTTFAPLAKRLKEDYPNLVTNYYRWDGITSGVSKGDKVFREGLQVGDSTLLSMYGFALIEGNEATALKQPFSAVITETAAMKYFGKKDIVGETITIQNFSGGKKEFSITGVLKKTTENSVLNINDNINNNVFIPLNTLSYFGRGSMDEWNNTWTPSYIEVKEGTDTTVLNKAIAALVKRHAPENIRNSVTVQAIPLTDYYINRNGGVVKRMLIVLSFTGLFILLMAIVNFINITISSSGNRIKEIGVRKVLGSMRQNLILQFLAESLILVMMAGALAVASYPLTKKLFTAIVNKELYPLTGFPLFLFFIPVVAVLIIGMAAGIYPAVVLSSLKTVDSLKGKIKTVEEKIWLRKSLAGFQFTIALLVLIVSVLISLQVNHFFNSNLGYNKDYMIAAQVPRDWSPEGVQKMKAIRNQFTTMPEISKVSLSFEIPNGNNGGTSQVYQFGSDSTTAIISQALVTDENFITAYGISLASGEFFDSRGLNSGRIVLNETAVVKLGFSNPEEAIGKKLRIHGDATVYTIKGVIKDFHFFSMEQAMEPVIFLNIENGIVHRYLSFKLKPGSIGESINALEKKWKELMPGSAFEFVFMDDAIKKMYAGELQLKKASQAATAVSLIIALLGVLGLVSLSIRKKNKEIGVRKVLGASFTNIIMLFVNEFIPVLLIAVVIASPLAYLLIKQWINNYAYRINISAIPFIVSILVVGFITLFLIFMQTFRTANTNPVKSLRTE